MNSVELAMVLDAHRTWLISNGAEGTRADLTGAVLTDAVLTRAYLTRADLTDAVLTRAYLTGADLTDAVLTDAVLRGADLTRADLTDAVLTDAVLTDAVLTGADLTGADLTGAVLTRAYLTRADLTDAVLTDAVLTDADLTHAVLTGAVNAPSNADTEKVDYAAKAARYRSRHPDVPVVQKLDSEIVRLVDGGTGVLSMKDWHTCETTHCRAGWAITLAGDAGRKLEEKYGPQIAGGMIYRASTGRLPDFFALKSEALKDIRKCAAEDA